MVVDILNKKKVAIFTRVLQSSIAAMHRIVPYHWTWKGFSLHNVKNPLIL